METETAGPGAYGELRIATLHDVRGCCLGLRIEHADPRVLITEELLRRIRASPSSPWATLNGSVLRITGTNRTVVYVIRRHLFAVRCYEAEWPD